MNKTVTVTIRTTLGEKKQIEDCAARLGMTNTEVILNGVKIIEGMIREHERKKGKNSETKN